MARKKKVLLATILFAAAVTTAAPATAQTEGVQAPPDGYAPPRDSGSLYSGAYEVTEEGDLVFGGDVRLACKDLVNLARFGAPAPPGSEDGSIGGTAAVPSTREAVELCAEAGFPPEGATFKTQGAPAADALPETGGAAPVAGAAGALLLVGGLLVRRLSR